MASTGVWFHTRYMRTGSPETPSSETLIDLQIGRTRNSSKSNASCGGIGSLYMCIPAALRIKLHRECGWTKFVLPRVTQLDSDLSAAAREQLGVGLDVKEAVVEFNVIDHDGN